MKRDALAFFRILPAGTADIGDDVSRADLRAAGVGDWALTDVGRDDLSDVLGGDYDEPVPIDDLPTEPKVPVVRLKIGNG